MKNTLFIPNELQMVIREYQRVRPLMTLLHSDIGKLAKADASLACARRLRMLSRRGGKKTITFAVEEETAIFQDYLIYMYRPRGINLVRQMINRNRYLPESDEYLLLQGMVQARFSVFLVEQILTEGGFVAIDIYSGDQFLILDQSMAQRGEVGLLMGIRIFPFQQVWMHTGAWLTLGKIEDVAGFSPHGATLTEKQEQTLNEEMIFQWRQMVEQLEG